MCICIIVFKGTIRDKTEYIEVKKIQYLKVLGIPMTTHTSSDSVEVLRLRDDCNHVHYLLQSRMHSRIVKGKAHHVAGF